MPSQSWLASLRPYAAAGKTLICSLVVYLFVEQLERKRLETEFHDAVTAELNHFDSHLDRAEARLTAIAQFMRIASVARPDRDCGDQSGTPVFTSQFAAISRARRCLMCRAAWRPARSK